ncbi:MAG: VOC family protein [Opitutaceae bacterium]|nr:VOC family protein [Opitutaceae bacterium]
MSIKIKEIAFVFHPTTDIARARGFYEKLLGLKVGMQIEFHPGQWWIEYDVAGVALAVSNAFPSSGSGGAGLTFEVASLDETLASIKAAKIPLTQELTEFPPCRMFSIKSPDGHDIMFHQRKAQS